MTDIPSDATVNPTAYFPARMINEIKVTLEQRMPSFPVVLRPIRATDPSQTIGVWSDNWMPVANTHIIGQPEPQEANYLIKVANVVKSADEPNGRALFSLHAKMIRAILYRDADLRVRLNGLEELMLGSVERVQRYNVGRQNYVYTGTAASFVYLCVTDVTFNMSMTRTS